MDTMDNNQAPERVVERDRVVTTDGGGSGWAVAIIVLLAVILVGGYFFMQNRGAAPAGENDAAEINVSLPVGDNDSNPSPTY